MKLKWNWGVCHRDNNRIKEQKNSQWTFNTAKKILQPEAAAMCNNSMKKTSHQISKHINKLNYKTYKITKHQRLLTWDRRINAAESKCFAI